MKKFAIVCIVFFFSLSGLVFGQIFTEDFESGTADESWELYWPDEENVTAVEMATAPAPLANGGSYVGLVHDADASYNGAGVILGGESSLADYSIEGDVYCYANHPSGSAYTGLIAYGDSTIGTYIKMVADFDGDQRIRLYNNRLDMQTFQYTFDHSFGPDDIPGGIPTVDGWHHMKVDVRSLGNGTTAYWCYFDGNELANCPIIDDGQHRMASGKYGLYAFQMDADGIPGYFDNIVVTALPPYGIEENSHFLPARITLNQNYPNPFNPGTTISYDLKNSETLDLTIYDILGKKITTLVSGFQVAGPYQVTWNGTDASGKLVPSGIYFYTLKAGSFSETRKMILTK